MIRSFPGRTRRWCLPACTAVVTSLAALPAAAAAPALSPPSEVHRHVTLLTGDEVDYIEAGDGTRLARIDAATSPDRPEVSFQTATTPAGMYVFPSDAAQLVSSGAVDRSVFNVTELAKRSTLDIFVRYAEGVSAQAMPAARHTAVASLNGVGLRVTKTQAPEVWRSVKSAGSRLAKVSLDRTVHVSLDHSTEQVGAPAAWAAGLDGTGTTVAVVDTGIDLTHPDLRDKVTASANFSDEPDITDTHGHGTHVASIIAGTGQASQGRYRGVAPGAKLMVAKVFGTSGEATEAQVMAGMEWAAANGAKVVNLSLGAGPPDGPDDMSDLVDKLTATTGALFVVAAGNSGPGAVSVETPGVAASALTVGAVDRQDKPADFSSRGPRRGDALAKPEITAPGQEIVAARAAGTEMGTPVSDSYTAASGTSMATPHVSGAAAILLQKHPQWTAAAVKNALSASAKDIGQPWFGQGCGRLDIASALGVDLLGPATLGPAGTLTYLNETAAPITLSLAGSLRSWSGKPAAITFGQKTITVPANGSTAVPVTVQLGEPGVYGGMITATSGTTTRHTVVSVYKAPDLFPVTVRVLDSAGQPRAASIATLVNDAGTGSTANDPFRSDAVTFLQADQPVQVPRGIYTAMGTTIQSDLTTRRWNAMSAPEVPVQGPTTIVLDERATVPVDLVAPQPLDQRDRTVMLRRVVPGVISEFGLAAGTTPWQVRATPAAAAKHGAITLQDVRSMQPTVVSEMSVNGTALHPEYDAFGVATTWPGDHEVPMVFTTATDVRGKVAVVAVPPGQSVALAAAQAASKGAAAVAIYIDSPGALPAPGLSSDAVPVFALSREEGDRVRRILSQGAASLRTSIAAQPDTMYNLSFVDANGIPAAHVQRIDRTRLVAVDTGYHADKPGLTAQKAWYAMPTGLWKTQFLRGTRFTPPAAWREYIGPVDDQTVWKRAVTLSGKDESGRPGSLTMFQQNTYRVGETGRAPEHWFAAPLHTGAVELQADHPARYPATAAGWQEICSLCRTGDLFVPALQWSDSTAGHYTSAWQSGKYAAASTARLFSGDTEIAPVNSGDPVALFPVFPLDAAPGRYRLETVDLPPGGQVGVPSQAISQLASRVDTTWTFQSRRTSMIPPPGFQCLGDGRTCAFQPLIQLAYDFGLDLSNRATGTTFTVTAAEHSGADSGGPVLTLQLSYSTDEGVTWQQARVTPLGAGRWSVTTPQLATGFVWVRTDARDSAGNTVRQTVQRAYAVR